MDESIFKQRVADLASKASGSPGRALAQEVLSGTLTVMHILYGKDSTQAKRLLIEVDKSLGIGDPRPVLSAVNGVLANLKAELDAGMLGDLRLNAKAEVLASFTSLARWAFEQDQSDGAKNVAGVLVAAAFEDTIRQLGERFTTVNSEGSERPKLHRVVDALKENGIIKGAKVSMTTSYLKFRNDALHADWEKIDRTTVGAVLAFVEGLLREEFR
jgi:hypothetical protein